MFRSTVLVAGDISNDKVPDRLSKRYQSTPVPAMWCTPSLSVAALAKLSLGSYALV